MWKTETCADIVEGEKERERESWTRANGRRYESPHIKQRDCSFSPSLSPSDQPQLSSAQLKPGGNYILICMRCCLTLQWLPYCIRRLLFSVFTPMLASHPMMQIISFIVLINNKASISFLIIYTSSIKHCGVSGCFAPDIFDSLFLKNDFNETALM